MVLKKEDITSKLGKKMYRFLFEIEKNKKVLDKAVIEPLPKPEYTPSSELKKQRKQARSYSALKEVPAVQTQNKAGELSDIVQEAREMHNPEGNAQYEKPKTEYAEPKQSTIPSSPSGQPVQAAQKPYKHVTRRQALQMCEQRGVIGEKVELLKLLSNITIKKSTLVEGASGAGKSWLLDHAFELVPENLKCITNDNKNFLELAKRYNGQFPFIVIGELQTFLRGSKNEKDIMRCIGNGEVYNFPLDDGTNLPISAQGVFACIADSNRYKKMFVEGDKELLRRFHRVYVTLTDDKMKKRLDAIASMQMPSYGALKEQEADLADIKNHMERTILLDIPQKRFFNPFARFVTQYILESCKGAGKMEDAAKIATYHKNYVLAGVKWNEKYRTFGKTDDEARVIAGIGDIFTAKRLTDSDLKEQIKDFDWYACWESGIESLKASGYPQAIISAYMRRQINNENKICLTDLIEDNVVELVDLSKPKPIANIIVTTEKYEPLGNKTPGNGKNKQDKQDKQHEQSAQSTADTTEDEILDAEYQILETGDDESIRAVTKGQKYLLPGPAGDKYAPDPEMMLNKANLPVQYGSNSQKDSKKGNALGGSSTQTPLLPAPDYSADDAEEIDPELKSFLPVVYKKNQNPAIGKTETPAGDRNNGLPCTERKYLTYKKDE